MLSDTFKLVPAGASSNRPSHKHLPLFERVWSHAGPTRVKTRHTTYAIPRTQIRR